MNQNIYDVKEKIQYLQPYMYQQPSLKQNIQTSSQFRAYSYQNKYLEKYPYPSQFYSSSDKFSKSNKQENPQKPKRIFDVYQQKIIDEPQIRIPQAIRTINKPPLGLSNMGNTCYLNSVIQALISIEVFTHYLVNNQQLSIPLLEIKKLYELLQNANYQYKSPHPQQFKKLLDEFCPIFRGYNQQDASECLMYVLQLLGNQKLITLSKQLNNVHDIKSEAEKAWKEFRSQEFSIITEIFHGMTFTLLNCQGCQKETVNIEEMSHILVELQQIQQPVDIQNQIILNAKEEQELSGFNCSQCQRTTKVLKKYNKKTQKIQLKNILLATPKSPYYYHKKI